MTPVAVELLHHIFVRVTRDILFKIKRKKIVLVRPVMVERIPMVLRVWNVR